MWANASAASANRVARVIPPSRSISSTIASYRPGFTTTVTDSKFFALARTIAGPPMSIFSIVSSKPAPEATVSRNG